MVALKTRVQACRDACLTRFMRFRHACWCVLDTRSEMAFLHACWYAMLGLHMLTCAICFHLIPAMHKRKAAEFEAKAAVLVRKMRRLAADLRVLVVAASDLEQCFIEDFDLQGALTLALSS